VIKSIITDSKINFNSCGKAHFVPECAFAMCAKAPKQCAISGFYVPKLLSVIHRGRWGDSGGKNSKFSLAAIET